MLCDLLDVVQFPSNHLAILINHQSSLLVPDHAATPHPATQTISTTLPQKKKKTSRTNVAIVLIPPLTLQALA
jgi:hypothetical protein